MGTRYNQDAIELARKLYCKFGGKNFDAIELEMRKQYPGWSKTNLVDRTEKGRGERFGWVTTYGFEKSLQHHIETLTRSVNNDEQELYLGIKAVRKSLQEKVVGKNANKDELYAYRDFCKLEIEARRNLDLSRDNLETFVSAYEKLTTWLSEIDPDAARMLIKHGDKLAELAQAHYGEAEKVDDGAGPAEDEGGQQPRPR